MILFSIQLITNDLFAQTGDDKIKDELAVQIAGGTQVNFKGTFLSGGVYYLHHRFKYSLQFDYTAYDYLKLKTFEGYLNYSKSGSVLFGYTQPLKKWNPYINVGLAFGKGRFKDHPNPFRNDINEYFETGFSGFTANGGFEYDILKRLSAGVSISFFKNLYSDRFPFGINSIKSYYGMQFGVIYKIKKYNTED